ncbi:MAG: hypothetical protein ACPGWS_09375, partial [Solirubrobacterales bacterium]
TTTDHPSATKRGGETQENPQGPTMDPTEMKAALSKAQDEAKAMRLERDTLKTALDTLEASKAEVVAERDQFSAQCESLATKLATKTADCDELTAKVKTHADNAVRAEVAALVGDKIAPHEVENLSELAITNRPLFDKFMSQRAPSTILTKDPAGMGEDPNPDTIAAAPQESALVAIINSDTHIPA